MKKLVLAAVIIETCAFAWQPSLRFVRPSADSAVAAAHSALDQLGERPLNLPVLQSGEPPDQNLTNDSSLMLPLREKTQPTGRSGPAACTCLVQAAMACRLILLKERMWLFSAPWYRLERRLFPADDNLGF
jgi:hypothetical protein